MKKLLLILGLLLPSPASAGVVCSVPFNLQNGTTADASQVMANYNALIACLANAAAAGVNTDLTSILGLTVPLSNTQGGTTVYFSVSPSTGSPNAQVVATTVPANFTLGGPPLFTFQAGLANTGPMTLNVNSTGAKNVLKVTSAGLQPLAAADIVTGQGVLVGYDGTEYQVSLNTGLVSQTLSNQSFSGGISITSFNNGTISGGGTLTVNCGQGPLQYYTNNGAMTFAADSKDGSCDFLQTNSAGAGAVSFSGFTVSANTGDALSTTNTNKFVIHTERVNGTSTYIVKALQ